MIRHALIMVRTDEETMEEATRVAQEVATSINDNALTDAAVVVGLVRGAFERDGACLEEGKYDLLFLPLIPTPQGQEQGPLRPPCSDPFCSYCITHHPDRHVQTGGSSHR